MSAICSRSSSSSWYYHFDVDHIIISPTTSYVFMFIICRTEMWGREGGKRLMAEWCWRNAVTEGALNSSYPVLCYNLPIYLHKTSDECDIIGGWCGDGRSWPYVWWISKRWVNENNGLLIFDTLLTIIITA